MHLQLCYPQDRHLFMQVPSSEVDVAADIALEWKIGSKGTVGSLQAKAIMLKRSGTCNLLQKKHSLWHVCLEQAQKFII